MIEHEKERTLGKNKKLKKEELYNNILINGSCLREWWEMKIKMKTFFFLTFLWKEKRRKERINLARMNEWICWKYRKDEGKARFWSFKNLGKLYLCGVNFAFWGLSLNITHLWLTFWIIQTVPIPSHLFHLIIYLHMFFFKFIFGCGHTYLWTIYNTNKLYIYIYTFIYILMSYR